VEDTRMGEGVHSQLDSPMLTRMNDLLMRDARQGNVEWDVRTECESGCRARRRDGDWDGVTKPKDLVLMMWRKAWRAATAGIRDAQHSNLSGASASDRRSNIHLHRTACTFRFALCTYIHIHILCVEHQGQGLGIGIGMVDGVKVC
jgi:hypothetical protein